MFDTLQFLKKHILKSFVVLLGIWILLTVIFCIVYSHTHSSAVDEITSFKSANAGLITDNNAISFWGLLLNNIKASALYLLSGFLHHYQY